MLILDADTVREALPMPLAIEAMRQAFEALSAGRAEQPPRARLPIAPNDGVSLIMPAFVNDDDVAKQALAVKVVSLYGSNPAKGCRGYRRRFSCSILRRASCSRCSTGRR